MGALLPAARPPPCRPPTLYNSSLALYNSSLVLYNSGLALYNSEISVFSFLGLIFTSADRFLTFFNFYKYFICILYIFLQFLHKDIYF